MNVKYYNYLHLIQVHKTPQKISFSDILNHKNFVKARKNKQNGNIEWRSGNKVTLKMITKTICIENRL